MPAVLFLLFFTIPAAAALSFEIKDFLLFMVLFCLVAGLSTASSNPETIATTESRRSSDQEQSQSNAAKASHAGNFKSSHAGRARTLPKLS